MAYPPHPIRQARIDVPLGKGCAYLYVGPDEAQWTPWWSSLYEYLLGLASLSMQWRYEPIQNVYVARAGLDEEQRAQLGALLRRAPPSEVARHRTLRRAAELPVERAKELDVMFFSGPKTEG